MIKRISKKYAMTEKGAKDYVAAVFWSVLVNISKMLPVGVLAAALSGITQALTDGTDPRAGLTRFIMTGILALLALFVTFLIQYRALYDATYRESANRRIRIAEVLRRLPKTGSDRPYHHHHGRYGDTGKGIFPLLSRHVRRANLHDHGCRRYADL